MYRSPRSLFLRTLLFSLLIILTSNVASVAQVSKKTTKNKQNKKTNKVETEKKKSPTDSSRTNKTDDKQIEALPLQAVRNIDNYSLLSPGVAPAPQTNGVQVLGTSGLFSVNGMRARSNNIIVDGADQNEEEGGGRRLGFATPTSQNIESIKEVQISTSLWSAESGRNFGSQVSTITKSGTNQVHGTVYDFFSHSALNARNYFDYTSDKWTSSRLLGTAYNRFNYGTGKPVVSKVIPVSLESTGSPWPNYVSQPNPAEDKDPFQRNMIGGVLGFPIKKNKTFVFGSFERQDQKAMRETHFAVPTIAQRGFLNHGARGYSVGGRPVEPSSFAGSGIFSLFPFENNPIGPYGENTYTQVLSADSKATILSTRLDHSLKTFGKDTTLTARYNFTKDQRDIPSIGNAIYSSIRPKAGTHNVAVFATTQFGASKINQLRASFGRLNLTFEELRDKGLLPSDIIQNAPYLLNAPLIHNYSYPGGDSSLANGEPIFVDMYKFANARTEVLTGPLGRVTIAPFSPLGQNTFMFPQTRENNTIQIADTLSWFRSNNTYKFGFDIRINRINSIVERNYRPEFIYGGVPDLTNLVVGIPYDEFSQFGPTPGYYNGSDLAALGLPTSIMQTFAIGKPDSNVDLRSRQFNFFINDNWKIRNGLTLDFGARYEFNTVPHDADNQLEQSLKNLTAHTGAGNKFLYDYLNRRTISNATLFSSYDKMVDGLRKIVDGRSSLYNSDNNNWSGHIGFAWDPFSGLTSQAGKTIIRGGAGIYHDMSLGTIVSQSRNLFPSLLPINMDANTLAFASGVNYGRPVNLPVPDNHVITVVTPGGLTTYNNVLKPGTLNELEITELRQFLGLLANPFNAVGLPSGSGLAFTLPERNLRTPYSLQFNFQIERELFENTTIDVGYVGSRGLKLARYRNPNGGLNSIVIPLDPSGYSVPLDSLTLPPRSFEPGRQGRPNPYLGAYGIYESSAASNYHSLQASLSQRFANSYQVHAAYTWSHAIDDVSDLFDLAGAYNLPQDDANLRAERGNANFDIRHRFVINAVGDLPFISKYNNSTGAKRLLFGNWQFSTISTFQTGQPFTVNTSYDVNLDGNLTDRVHNGNALVVDDNGRNKLKLNTQAWKVLAATESNGSVGRNTFRSDGVVNVDLAIIKNFRIKEGQTLVFRTEAFNLLNKTHFGTPVRILEAANFGQSVDTSVNSRQIQFALKYIF